MENQKARAKRLWNNYGTTPEEWDRVDAFQGRVCWLCGRPERTGKRLSTDHSHIDGLFRGLLCSQCNPLIGKLENAFIRLGMHKVPGVSLIKIVERLGGYFANPPAVQALGKQVFGYAGRVGTKTHRKVLKKLAKEAKKQAANLKRNK